jgi:ubiquinone/menaquinone biosynthesis C-methylase UbiE
MTTETKELPSPPKNRKPYKGLAMEGAIAKWYAKNQQNSISQYRAWAEMVKSRIKEGADVLEVAPGPGYLSIELAKLGRYSIVGLDVSKTFVKIATEKARSANASVAFRQGDAAYMPLSDSSFDFVVCTSAFKNFPEPVKVMNEIFRVLKPTGEAVIIDLRTDSPKEEIDEYVDSLNLSKTSSFVTKLIFKQSLLKSAHTRNELLDYAARSNFGSCEIREEGLEIEIWLRKS